MSHVALDRLIADVLVFLPVDCAFAHGVGINCMRDIRQAMRLEQSDHVIMNRIEFFAGCGKGPL